MLPPLPAIGRVRIELFGPPTGEGAKWDEAHWDVDVWEGAGWQDITPESLNVQITWGTDDNMGALSVCSAGSWQVATYDPTRLLDPANYDSPFAGFLQPGGMVRVLFNQEVVRVGFIDEIAFDIGVKTGSIRATDGVSLMVKAKVPAGLAHAAEVPLTLRAFARYMLAKASVDYIRVEADPVPPAGYDPAIGLAIDEEASVWQQITAAALDALHAVWLDRDGMLRFRYFGSPRQSNVRVGGDIGIPIDEVQTRLSMEGVFNHAIARYYSLDEVWHEAKKQDSVDLYGDLLIRRERPIPNSAEWVDQILQDRGAASVQYDIGTLRPRTQVEVSQILSLGMVDKVGLHVTKHGTPINRDVIVLGGSIEANTDTGMSAKLTTYEPASPWWNKNADRLYQRKVVSNLCVGCTVTWNGSTLVESGDGGGDPTPEMFERPDENLAAGDVHAKSIMMKFPAIDFNTMGPIWDAKLRLYLPKHDDPEIEGEGRLDHGTEIICYIIENDWVASNTCSAIVTGGTQAQHLVNEQGEWMEIDFRPFVAAWESGHPMYGVRLYSIPGNPGRPQHIMIEGSSGIEHRPHLLITYKQ